MLDTLRNLTKSGEEKQQEALNAYLDDALSPSERRRFEQRLARDADLRAQLQQIRVLKQQLRQLPHRRVPRNFTLDPALYGRRQKVPLFQPVAALRLATVLTAFFFVLAVAADLFLAQGGAQPVPEGGQGVALLSEEPAAEMAIEVTRVVTDEVRQEFVEVETETVVEVQEEAEEEAAAEEALEAVPAAEAPVEQEVEALTMPDTAGEALEGEALSPTVSSFAETTLRAPASLTPTPTGEATPTGPGAAVAAATAPRATATVSAPPRPAAETVESDRAIGALPGESERPEADAISAEATVPVATSLQRESPSGQGLSPLRLLQIILAAALIVLLLITILMRRRRV